MAVTAGVTQSLSDLRLEYAHLVVEWLMRCPNEWTKTMHYVAATMASDMTCTELQDNIAALEMRIAAASAHLNGVSRQE